MLKVTQIVVVRSVEELLHRPYKRHSLTLLPSVRKCTNSPCNNKQFGKVVKCLDIGIVEPSQFERQ